MRRQTTTQVGEMESFVCTFKKESLATASDTFLRDGEDLDLRDLLEGTEKKVEVEKEGLIATVREVVTSKGFRRHKRSEPHYSVEPDETV